MKRLLPVAAAAALVLVASASAAPSPSVASPVYAMVQGYPGVEFSVSWSLGLNEYGQKEFACGLLVGSPSGSNVILVDPGATSAAGSVQVKPGETVTVVLQTAAVLPSTLPYNACFQQRQMATATFVAPAAPAPAPTAPAPTTTTATTSTTTTTTATTGTVTTAISPVPAPALSAAELEKRIADLEAALAALASRVDALQAANIAAWDAWVAATAQGLPPYEVALAARSAGLNAIYGLPLP